MTPTAFSCVGYNVMRGSAIMTLTLIIFMFLTSALIAVSAIYTAR